MKPCTHCQKVKPLTDYHKDHKEPDGHFTRCKECRRKKAQQTLSHYQQQVCAEVLSGLSPEEQQLFNLSEAA